MSDHHEPDSNTANAIERVLHETNARLYDNWTKWIGTILSIAIIVIGWASFNAWERNEALARRVEEFLDKQSERNQHAYDRLTNDFTVRTERIERESIDRIKQGLGTIDSRQSLNETRLSEIKSDVQTRVNDLLSGVVPSFAIVVGNDTIYDGHRFYLPRGDDNCTGDILVVNTGKGVARNVTLSLLLDTAYEVFDYSEGVYGKSRDSKYPFRIGFGDSDNIRPSMYSEFDGVCFYPRDGKAVDTTVRGRFVINHDGEAVVVRVSFTVKVASQ